MRKPASREITSASVAQCETQVCFLHIQLIGTNVWLPKMHKSPPDIDFESSKSPAKSKSWNSPNLNCCAVSPTEQYCLNSHVWWMCEIKRAKRLSHAFVHFVNARTSLFTDHKIPVYQSEPNTDISEHLWANSRYFSNRSIFFVFQMMVIQAWRCDFKKMFIRFIQKFAPSVHAFLRMTFLVIGP